MFKIGSMDVIIDDQVKEKTLDHEISNKVQPQNMCCRSGAPRLISYLKEEVAATSEPKEQV
jgi:hypothetical protein